MDKFKTGVVAKVYKQMEGVDSGENPRMEHWEAAKRVLRHIKGKVGEGLAYSPGEVVAVWGYSDASYGSDNKTKKGRSGFVFVSGGAAVS